MSFLFVDRILEFESGKNAKGIKHVTALDTYLKKGINGKNALFSCIIGETLGQLTAWIAMHANGFSMRPVAGIVDEVHIFDDAYVGDTLLLETKINTLDDRAVLYDSVATVRNKKIFEIKKAMGPMLPMEDFIDTELVRRQFNFIDRQGHSPEPATVETSLSLEKSQLNTQVGFDHILEMDSGKQLVAQKNVSFTAPYFSDHFPRKPVLPLTLLLESKLQLATFFLTDLLGEKKASTIHPVHIQNIKMKQFVNPADSILTHLQLKESTDDTFLFSFKSQVDGKTVCVLTATFAKKSGGER